MTVRNQIHGTATPSMMQGGLILKFLIVERLMGGVSLLHGIQTGGPLRGPSMFSPLQGQQHK